MNQRRMSPYCEADEFVVRGWMRLYLRQHLEWWLPKVGQVWTAAAIEARIETVLLPRELEELRCSARESKALVAVLREGEAPLGLVYAEYRTDRYLDLRSGVLSWVYVVPERRGEGLARALLSYAHDWMIEQGCALREVFVTSANERAVALYVAEGYHSVDQRLLAPAERPRAPINAAGPATNLVGLDGAGGQE
ncbi:MAG: GNAT family N-acetyltransferase [Deltaproteobacteria bacterium]